MLFLCVAFDFPHTPGDVSYSITRVFRIMLIPTRLGKKQGLASAFLIHSLEPISHIFTVFQHHLDFIDGHGAFDKHPIGPFRVT